MLWNKWINICDHPWEKGARVNFGKMRLLSQSIHQTFILLLMCIGVAIATLSIKYSLINPLPEFWLINRKPEVACFSCNAYYLCLETLTNISAGLKGHYAVHFGRSMSKQPDIYQFPANSLEAYCFTRFW